MQKSTAVYPERRAVLKRAVVGIREEAPRGQGGLLDGEGRTSKGYVF